MPFAGPLEVVIFHTLHTPPHRCVPSTPMFPAELETICLKALSKKPEDRYASCRELAKDLGKWLPGGPVTGRSRATGHGVADVEGPMSRASCSNPRRTRSPWAASRPHDGHGRV